MKVRKAELPDLPQIAALWKCVRAKRNSNRWLDYTEEDFLRIIPDEIRALVLVCCEDKEILGLSIAFDMVTWGYLDAVGIDPGRNRNGLGSALMEANFFHAKKRGWRSLEVCYDVEDGAAGKFLRDHGWFDLEKSSIGEPINARWLVRDMSHSDSSYSI